MARTAKKDKRGYVETLDKNLIAVSRIGSAILVDERFILLDKKGQTISYTELKPDEDGKTPADADICTQKIIDASKADPLLQLGRGNYVRCSAIEAVENHSGSDYKGLLFRGEGDAILAFLAISTAEKRDLAVSKLHVAMESFEAGKFEQPDLAGIF
ncbi:TPA: hypothetical protein KDZ97_005022 [Vibrio parahaemolyticus]|uniref:hypothetical protein n=1 Tax=Vibrio parahaemolyticus TaxID=670 RepID=UPI000BE28D61|nr:hypothetical protein [Vibrio parahaemolyticus]ATI46745.1 hypothetical protein CO725_14060 [Vibrio parahaemolyticus]HBC3540444.1 hypothetical protein [Vibrio parahaemolyticus]HBC3816832.1 hypothetical protein [Vibrio parahaemolyticus]